VADSGATGQRKPDQDVSPDGPSRRAIAVLMVAFLVFQRWRLSDPTGRQGTIER
jgi:hypothetical protein